MAGDFQISTLDMAAVNSALAITEGVACDPPYLYVTPHDGYVVAKIDTGTFTIVDTLDLSQVSSGLTGMLGSFVVDGFLYVLPHFSSTGPVYQDDVVRVDLTDFTPAGCTTLAVLDATQTFNGSDGFTDGVNGYLNVQGSDAVSAVRFGLGADFVADSVATVSVKSVEGYPVMMGNLVAVDDKAAYLIATVETYPGTGNGDRTMDLWLVSVPTDDFTLDAAQYQRLTDIPFVGGSVPEIYTALDDGTNLWTYPMPMTSGSMAGTFLGVMKIPKADPAAVAIYHGPEAQPYPSEPSANGMAFYDGCRYGYLPAQTVPQILQLDTQNPGTVNIIDISASSAGYPMYGLGYDGQWGYAVSFNGGAGLCLRFLPTPES